MAFAARLPVCVQPLVLRHNGSASTQASAARFVLSGLGSVGGRPKVHISACPLPSAAPQTGPVALRVLPVGQWRDLEHRSCPRASLPRRLLPGQRLRFTARWLSAVIEADYRMPKPTKEDREGHGLCRKVPRHLKQCHKRVHVTSPLAEQSNPNGWLRSAKFISLKCVLLHAARV
jgi:hypothetical protein